LTGIYIGKGDPSKVLNFNINISGTGEYTFESTQYPGFYLTFDPDAPTAKLLLA
jgi:hypothetical protein